MATTRYETLSQTITKVMTSLGLAAPAAIVGTSDRTAEQMVSLATDVGQWLAEQHDWQIMSDDLTITTTPGVSTYALPADFNGFIMDAQWNYTTRLPAIGALSDREWQMLKARQLEGTTFTMLFRIDQDNVEFYDTPSTTQTIVMPYRSRGWAKNAANVRIDVVSANDDVILFDPLLFRTALKVWWQDAKGFDTQSARKTLNEMITLAKAKDSPGRTISLSQTAGYPYLGVINIPDTGYGS